MFSRDTYPVGLKGPSSLCEFVTSSSCGQWYQSFLNKLSEVLHLRRCNRISPYHTHIRDCPIRRV